VIARNYEKGKKIHWSGTTSTSMDAAVAEAFAKSEGVVFRITASSARVLGEISVLPGEAESILLPNFKALVTKGLYTERGINFVDVNEIRDADLYVF